MQSNSLPGAENPLADIAYGKITRRVAPVLFMCALMNYMDRLNVGYAQLQMKEMLHFSDAIYGLGAAIFFIGYFVFEVPSNLLLPKVGARSTLFRIMFLWGLASTSTMFVRTPTQYYVVRFLLGVFEAGFYPGVLLYLTYWFPPARQARMVSFVFVAGVVAGVVAGGVSGWILQNMNGVNGWQGWQWMFLLEGIPSCVLAIVTYVCLSERPANASWLSEQEKELVSRDIAAAVALRSAARSHPARQPFFDPMVYLLSFALFAVLCGLYALIFWLPTVIHGLGVSNMQHIGLYSMIPSAVGAVAMILYGKHSDLHVERRWHFALAAVAAAFGLCVSTMTSHSLGLSLALFALANAGISGALPVFWAMSYSQLSARESVAGIAIITSLSNLAGVFSPYALGLIKTATGSLANGLYVISGLLIVAVLFVLLGVPAIPSSRDATDGAKLPSA
ncbi:MFS transporter [Burkholderia sp. S171]|uniref:MFS transporter n=1 Tax=Burkholderia sp. S171 TaxID=1641860 RepID=UPI00131C5CB1|nr:MFS transporter [Burkholderia sp. S171]